MRIAIVSKLAIFVSDESFLYCLSSSFDCNYYFGTKRQAAIRRVTGKTFVLEDMKTEMMNLRNIG